MKQTIPLYQVGAFKDQLFRGNPAAVCLLNAPRNAAWMQDERRMLTPDSNASARSIPAVSL